LLAFGLFFMTRYAPDFGFFMLTSEHKRKIQRGWKHIPLKSSSWRRESKRKPKRDGKAAACYLIFGFSSACFPGARRFWATFPRHS
jgi:hypothetical protein